MKPLKLLVLSIALLSLPACKTLDGVMAELGATDAPSSSSPLSHARSEEFILNGNCPKVEIVEDLATLNEFIDPAKPQSKNLISRVHLNQAESACDYAAKSVTVDLKLAFDGMLGPRGRITQNDTPFFSYPFFVAVTEPDGDILAKEVFAASMTYDAGKDRQTYFEDMRQIIPMPNAERGPKYTVLVGFQLSQEQLDYNREMIRQAREAARAKAEADKAAAKAAEKAQKSAAPQAAAQQPPVIIKKSETVETAPISIIPAGR